MTRGLRFFLGMGLVVSTFTACGNAEQSGLATLAPAGVTDDAACRQQSDLTNFIAAKLREMPWVPGLAAAAIKGDEVVYEHAFGMANLETGQKVRTDTPFILDSVSKMVTATAFMQLVEKGKVGLDDDVNNYLPFSVRNPNFPEIAITPRMLMMNTSSVTDNWDVMPYVFWPDAPQPLGEFIQSYLDPAGAIYDPVNNYGSWAPGTTNEYSNIGIALIGRLVEVIAKQPYDAYTQRSIFAPLGMKAVWSIADFGKLPVPVAMPYSDDGTGNLVALGQYSYPDYPDGALRTDLHSLEKFMIAHMNGGRLSATQRILKPETANLMHQATWDPQVDGLGFMAWEYGGFDTTFVGHEGGDLGSFTEAFWSPTDKVGFIVLANGDYNYVQPLADIIQRLVEEGANAKRH